MRKWLRIAGQAAIAVFFFCHALAVGLYAIPMNARPPAAVQLRTYAIKPFLPYMLITSQWQQWNLFSPDPLRRVSRYRVERKLPDGKWQVLRWITPDTYEWWRHVNHYKMFIGMLEGDQDTFNPAVYRHFLLMHCAPNALPPKTEIRLGYVQYVVSTRPSFWKAFSPDPWPPRFRESFSEPAFCP
jgi:hypothetical protein